MKSHLAHLLPVWRACEILGPATVQRIVASLLLYRQQQQKSSSSSASSSSSTLAVNSSSSTAAAAATTSTAATAGQIGGAGSSATLSQSASTIATKKKEAPMSSKATTATSATTPAAVSSSVEMMQELDTLVPALFYRHPPVDRPDAPLPPAVAQTWKKWLTNRNLALDRQVLLHFLVPANVQPTLGPGGHQGLFDCWIYALQGHAPTSSATYYGGANTNLLILIPDVLIVLAICQDYRNMQAQHRHQPQSRTASSATMPPPPEYPPPPPPADEAPNHDAAALWGAGSRPTESHLSPAGRDPLQRVPSAEEPDANRHLPSHDPNVARERTVWTMALLAYRIYDSYQKKATLTRDTIHRFMTDVHGEDSYKEPATLALLDAIFDDAQHSKGWLQASISELQFCQRVQETFSRSTYAHWLLDWMATLGCAFIPPPEVPPSVTAFLEAMHQPPRPLCDIYDLAEHRLFEIKRRFHSLVRSSSPLIQGDPMMGSSSTATTTSSSSDLMAAAPPAPSTTSSSSSSSNAWAWDAHQPKHVITEQAFGEAVSTANEEMGSGGYLPPALARLVFRAAGRSAGTSPLGSSPNSRSGDPWADRAWMWYDQGRPLYWTLYHVMQFGCLAVRQNKRQMEEADLPLLRFVMSMFQMPDPLVTEQEEASSTGGGGGGPSSVSNETALLTTTTMHENPRVLTRTQVARLILYLVEYVGFRRTVDAPSDGDKHPASEPLVAKYGFFPEEALVDASLCALVGLAPHPRSTSSRGGSSSSANNTNNGTSHHSHSSAGNLLISVKSLVDEAMAGTADKEGMTFEELYQWNLNKTDDVPRTKLGPFFLDLRLIASVLFGIPPTLASLEVALVAEIERRHRYRYPQSDVSRRGPRGTVWYLIDAGWFKAWAELVKQVAHTPEDNNDGRGDASTDKVRGLGRINNTGLLVENGSLALRADIRWKHDYEILPPLAWSAQQAWYDGGPPIYRSVVRYVTNASSPHSAKPRIPTEYEIELYPLFVRVYLCDAGSRGQARPFQQNYQLSRVGPVGVMLVQLCKELDVDPDAARLWVMGQEPDAPSLPPDLLEEDWILNLDMNIVDQRKRRNKTTDTGRGITLLLEIKDKESGLWPRGHDGRDWAVREKTPSDLTSSDLGDGVVGLYNMGNTCYLNSSIQCLSHTPIFREYFTSKAYLKDINTTNPLGHQGQLAQVSAVLINSLWKRFNQAAPHQPKRVTAPGSYALVNAPALTPKTFKDSLGKFSEHFAGNEQHDAQELLAFILGGLSEDLNRIVEKPYIEAPDSDGRPDSELADIWWKNHLKREMSIVVALFTGQYKSLLSCRTCKYESARFEPFLFLQLPLPEDDHYLVTLILYSVREGVEPMKYCVRVDNDGKLRDVLIALAKMLHGDEAEELNLIESENGKPHDDADEAKAAAMEEFYIAQAQNLAVVDMREGFIAKIAPPSWSLHDLQNKETGELPLLHIYELDAFAENQEQANAAADNAQDGEVKEGRSKPAFIAVAQRRSDLISRDILHPLAHRVFGTPLLLRINNLESLPGRELYDLVAIRLRNVVPKSVLRFLTGNVETTSTDEQARKRPRDGSSAWRTTTDMEEVSAGSMPRYGFRLRATTREGRRCLYCPWYECCIGCILPDDDEPVMIADGDSIAVDWHFVVDVATSGFGSRANSSETLGSTPASPPRLRLAGYVPVKNHTSCNARKGGQIGAITLEECLDAFAQEERIPDTYCSRCKDFRVQTKRMSLWRLPPIVIIHLKRFQFTQHMRRKLRDLVVFPVEGLDLSRIMAHETEASLQQGEEGLSTSSSAAGLENEAVEKDSVVTGDLTDDEDLKDSGRNVKLYDLYGVVHHQGALSGGHYVASLKSELDGQWRLFNDAQIYEIHARDVVDSSAYILFYIRRDVSQATLSDFWDVRQGGASINEEDMDQLIKSRSDRCSIS